VGVVLYWGISGLERDLKKMVTINSALKNQQEAVGSIFQPITGKIATQFKQISGSPTPVTGIFYAAGARQLRMVITRDMVVPTSLFTPIPLGGTDLSCFDLYPNATNVKPDFWVD
jgi:hypothetical protein